MELSGTLASNTAAARTAERKMSRSAKDDGSLLVHDSAASQLTSAASHITHTLAVIQNAVSKMTSCCLDNRGSASRHKQDFTFRAV
jgi:phage baseplate assembly protein gpV